MFARFSVRNPILINILTLAIIAVGIVAYSDLPREMFPDVQFEVVNVTTLYPGVGPKEVENLITVPIENAIATVDDIDHIVSSSAEGFSNIRVELERGADAARIALDIESAISRAADLPADAEDPVVKALVPEQPVLTVAIASTLPETELRSLARNLEDELVQLDGVSSVTAAGVRDREILVEVDPERLRTMAMAISEVMAALRAQNIDLPGGRLETERGEYFIRTMGKLEDAASVRAVVVRTDPLGGVVTVGDVANVYEGFADPTTIGHIDGERSVYLNVMKRTGDDYIDISDTVQAFVAGYTALPDGTTLDVVNDTSKYVRRRLATMNENGLFGLILVMGLLFLVLNGKFAFITAVGIPVAFLGTFIIMQIAGLTSNMLTMFGLVLVLGMLVDDAIVVTENVFRHITEGKSPEEAAIVGAGEVAIPIVAAVGTTMAAFLALAFLPGDVGKFMQFIPVVVIAALAVSILEAVLILPAHLAEWTKPWRRKRAAHADSRTPEPGESGSGVVPTASAERVPEAAFVAVASAPERPVIPRSLGAAAAHDEQEPSAGKRSILDEGGIKEPRWFIPVRNAYGTALTVAVRYKKTTALLVTAVFGGLLALAGSSTRFVAFPATDVEVVEIAIETAPGTRIEETERIVSEVERALLELPAEERDVIVTTIGSKRSGFGMTFGGNIASVNLNLTDEADRARRGMTIFHDVEARVASIAGAERIEVGHRRAGPPVGSALEVRVRGESFDVAHEIAKRVAEEAKGIPGTRDVRLDTEAGKDEARIRLKTEAAASLGIDVAAVATAVRNAFDGGLATRIQDGDEEIDVVVGWPERVRTSIADLESLLVANRSGLSVPLTNVAEVTVAPGFGELHRYDRKSAVTVLGDVDAGSANAFDVNRVLEAKAMGIASSSPGYLVDFGGEDEQTQELLGGLLRAFALALLLMYAIMAALFRSWSQPLIILATSVPFGFAGVVLGLWVSGHPMSIIGMVGAVALTGIVVNDSIVMIDFINKARAEGLSVERAVVEAGKKRLRPILLTSLTTILGLLPLALGVFGAEEFLMPMANSIVWGLGFATLLILIVVPTAYALLEDAKGWLFRRLGFATAAA